MRALLDSLPKWASSARCHSSVAVSQTTVRIVLSAMTATMPLLNRNHSKIQAWCSFWSMSEEDLMEGLGSGYFNSMRWMRFPAATAFWYTRMLSLITTWAMGSGAVWSAQWDLPHLSNASNDTASRGMVLVALSGWVKNSPMPGLLSGRATYFPSLTSRIIVLTICARSIPA